MTKFNMGKNIIKPIFIFIILSPSFVKFSYNLTVAIFTLFGVGGFMFTCKFLSF